MKITVDVNVNLPDSFIEVVKGIFNQIRITSSADYALAAEAFYRETEASAEAFYQEPEPMQDVPLAETFPYIKLEDLRLVANEKMKAGKKDAIKELLTKFGAERLSDVPEEKYGAFYDMLEGV